MKVIPAHYRKIGKHRETHKMSPTITSNFLKYFRDLYPVSWMASEIVKPKPLPGVPAHGYSLPLGVFRCVHSLTYMSVGPWLSLPKLLVYLGKKQFFFRRCFVTTHKLYLYSLQCSLPSSTIN
jgi:hypothetical protein